jgi:hypothetical protein
MQEQFKFQDVEGLQLKGVFKRILRIQESQMVDGVIWMQGSILTEDTKQELKGELWIMFKTPYPAEVDSQWRVADFIAWLVSHEMMECVCHQDVPLFNTHRLAQDHEAWDFGALQRRLSIIRDRYQDDKATRRWDDWRGLLSQPLGLELIRR